MTTKQVKTVATETPAKAEATPNSTSVQNLYMSIETFDHEGRCIGERVVDIHHYNTSRWLQKHVWWAMHNSNDVEIKPATPEKIAAYLEAGKEALAGKYNAPAQDVVEPHVAQEVAA